MNPLSDWLARGVLAVLVAGVLVVAAEIGARFEAVLEPPARLSAVVTDAPGRPAA